MMGLATRNIYWTVFNLILMSLFGDVARIHAYQSSPVDRHIDCTDWPSGRHLIRLTTHEVGQAYTEKHTHMNQIEVVKLKNAKKEVSNVSIGIK